MALCFLQHKTEAPLGYRVFMPVIILQGEKIEI